ncbi:MAG: hypothetical protein K8T90_08160 [Planctomycetes bacterium]|nr:hypothetical protein [Planctomycetota bacterium]
MNDQDARTELLWRFVRGDTSPATFEQWVCTTPELEPELGPNLYMQAISASYGRADEVDAVRKEIESFLVTCRPAPCACLEMRDLQVLPMGQHERQLRTFVEMKPHGKPLWWLDLERCSACGQWWLMAAEERKNDVYCLRRMHEAEAQSVMVGGTWPTDFHRYETLIRLGIAADSVSWYLDPMDARWTIADLARERPGIRVSEIAELVTLDVEVAAMVAREAVLLDGVEITFDVGSDRPLGDLPDRRSS